ncbi:MAG TPA: DUF4388 domain-containing protein [Acidimicrobiales bacterium]|nr:DUF4388 domain-containing protein [Acidimicrobiales bacterium]
MRGSAPLSGTLVDVRPRTLLQFLSLTGKSGVVRARGHEHVATVRFVGGRVVGADAAVAVAELLRLGNGEFEFDETVGEPADDGAPVADVLAAADELVAEWEEISQVVPSLGLVVRLRACGEAVHLSGDAWDVVAALAGGAVTPPALADHLGLPLLRVCRAVKELVDGGRADLLPPQRSRRVLAGRARAVLAKAEPRPWHAADRPLWPGAGSEPARARKPWDDPDR